MLLLADTLILTGRPGSWLKASSVLPDGYLRTS
jgi:hypothetical protein